MEQSTIKSIISIAIIIVALGVVFTLMRWLFAILLPISIIIVAGYIVYKYILKR